ncbi:hypothetical protein [Pseudogemmobacter bohemicus]|uniref:hypothetical protein n=1 Tax=Pseudogemmobacter bohemicus TaxID=2250708 RepID=UPI000DD2BE91|nr:hypothetical protein [Pseudogemmobacter bohemicus]
MSQPATRSIPSARASAQITDAMLCAALDAAQILQTRPLSNAEAALLELVTGPALEELLLRRAHDSFGRPLALGSNVIPLPVAVR